MIHVILPSLRTADARRFMLRAGVVIAWLVATSSAPAVDFARDVYPILKKHCFECHGAGRQEAGLRLDTKERALRGGDSGAAIRPGNSAGSELVKRITSADDSERMPQEAKPLSADEIKHMREWIDAGVEWPADAPLDAAAAKPHWAFVRPQRPATPQVSQSLWAHGPLDRLVLAHLDREKLSPSPPAERATLARRLSLDLIGLPPTVDEVHEFIADSSPDATERLVDRLLASPRYGERWARRWLDLARYADTNGYEKDRPRTMWPYRDGVIRALNADQPFDQFTLEQLAGDMLPGATLDQRIATGFHRNTLLNEEGGVDVEEFRFHAMNDRVATTGTIWLGLTIGCAQCHSHKYDPVTQREYYQFFALLNNADEPDLPVPSPALASQRLAIERQIAQHESQLASRFPMPAGSDATDRPQFLRRRTAAWAQDAAAKAVAWEPLRPLKLESRYNATFTTLSDESVLVSGDKPNYDSYTIHLHATQRPITAIRLEVLPDESLPDGGPGRAPLFSVGDFLLSEISVQVGSRNGVVPLAPAKLVGASHSFAQSGRSAAQCLDGDLDTGWSIQGAVGQRHTAVFRFEKPIEFALGALLVVKLEQRYIHQMTIGRFRLSVTSDPRPVEASKLPHDVERLLTLPESQRSDADWSRLQAHYLTIAPELAPQQTQLAALRRSLPKYPQTLVLAERSTAAARTTHIHQRGEFLKLGERVKPGVPEFLHPLPAGVEPNRLALARWLVDRANPLVGRVVMNRHWEAFFGRGLVRTMENFGRQAAAPSHPELLDGLAVEFFDQDLSLKRMHRQIVTSATYQQSSRATPAAVARDRFNEHLARGPRHRLEAEAIRDVALAHAGLLSPRLGGSSVFPPQPAGVTALAYGNVGWETSRGEDRYRRGLYTYAKRTAPYAMFATLDAPSGETTCPRRERSNTPLQALTLLNDEVLIEASRGLAKLTVREVRSPEERARYLLQRCLARAPDAEEVALVVKFHDKQQRRIDQGELKPHDLLGLEATAKTNNAADLAAWTTVARAILNLDETITKE